MNLHEERRQLDSELSRQRAQRHQDLSDAVERAARRLADANRELLDAAGGPADAADRARAAAAVAQAQAALDSIAGSVNSAKTLASRRKDEIAGWKAWFAALPIEQQPLQTAALAHEVDWRAEELNRLTVQIAAGTGELLQRQGDLVQARSAQAAAEHGLPDRDDPGAAELYARVDEARAALEPALVALHAAETAEVTA
jgi:hypothetical protein